MVRDRAIPNPIMLSVTGMKSLTHNGAPKNALTLVIVRKHLPTRKIIINLLYLILKRFCSH